jgi:phage terminase small subunit
MALNTRQEAFCQLFAKLGNAAEAYEQAGYDCKNRAWAQSSASRLMSKPEIKARIAELAEELASERIAGIREIQEHLTAILRGERIEEQIVVEGVGDGVSEARTMKRKPQLKDAIKAGELLARMQGGLDNNAAVNVIVPVFGGEDELRD